jgi:hypothetical protein
MGWIDGFHSLKIAGSRAARQPRVIDHFERRYQISAPEHSCEVYS